MAKQYKYIGQDPQKKGRIAKLITEIGRYNFYQVWDLTQDRTTVHKDFIENEPTIWEEIREESVFKKIVEDYLNFNDSNEINCMEFAIKKHLGITRENVHKELIVHMGITNRSDYIDHIRKLLEDRGLLID